MHTLILQAYNIQIKEGLGGRLDWVYFEVSPNQVARFASIGRDPVRALLCHADTSGNFEGIGVATIHQFDPDIIFCCHPASAKRANPSLSSKIALWHDGKTVFSYSGNTITIGRG